MAYLNSFRSVINSRLDERKKKNVDKKTEDDQTDNEFKEELNNQPKTNTKIRDQEINQNNIQNVVTKESAEDDHKIVIDPSLALTEVRAQEKEDPEEKLKELNQKYELLDFYEAPENLRLTEKDVPTFDREKVQEEKTNVLTKEYDQKKKEATEDFKKVLLDLEFEKDSLAHAAEKEKDEINNVFDSEVFAVENQAIKRGLARSSIVLMQLSRVESERAENLTETMRKLESNINSIESKIETKTRELDLAIEALDIEKIDKIEKEISKAYDEYKKEYDEVIEFNNNVKKLEAEYKIKYEKAKAEHKEDILALSQYGYDEYRKKLDIAKYNYMVSYLSQFDKDQAFEIFFRNSNFKELLGDNYQKIVDYLYSRK